MIPRLRALLLAIIVIFLASSWARIYLSPILLAAFVVVSIKLLKANIARRRMLSQEKATPIVEQFVKKKLRRLAKSDPATVAKGSITITDSDAEHLMNELAANEINLPPDMLASVFDTAVDVHIGDAQLRVARRPEIGKFISLYVDPSSEWPGDIAIPETDVEALRQILFDQGWDITSPAMLHLVQIGLDDMLARQFSKAFKRHNKWLPSQPLEEDLTRAYVTTFMNNTSYLGYLEEFAIHAGIETSIDNLEYLVEQEIEKQTRDRRIKRISEAMETGRHRERVSISDVDEMDGIDFEQFVAKLFAAMGYSTELTQQSCDQGADVIAARLNERVAIQAKRYSGTVSNSAIQEVVAAKRVYDCTHAMVITNSEFSPSAIKLAQANGVELVDRGTLKSLISKWL